MTTGPPLPLLKRLFEAAGYRVDVRPEALVALRHEDHRAVVLCRGRRSPSELEPFYPPDAVRRSLVYESDPGAAVREEAASHGIEVLDAATVGPALGELLLPAPSLPVETDDPAGRVDPLDAPFPLLPSEARTVRPRLDRTDAERRAGVKEARYTLRLVPYYVAAYRVRGVAADGGRGPVAHRLVAVNAVSRATEFWEEGERELVDAPDAPATRLPPQVGEVLAGRLALEAVRRQHAGRVDHTEQHGGALVIESRRVLPPVEDVRLGPLSLLLVPFWYAEGTDGRVVLDAVTGRSAPFPEPAEGRGVPD